MTHNLPPPWGVASGRAGIPKLSLEQRSWNPTLTTSQLLFTQYFFSKITGKYMFVFLASKATNFCVFLADRRDRCAASVRCHRVFSGSLPTPHAPVARSRCNKILRKTGKSCRNPLHCEIKNAGFYQFDHNKLCTSVDKKIKKKVYLGYSFKIKNLNTWQVLGHIMYGHSVNNCRRWINNEVGDKNFTFITLISNGGKNHWWWGLRNSIIFVTKQKREEWTLGEENW